MARILRRITEKLTTVTAHDSQDTWKDIGYWTLRFDDKGTEAGFMHSRFQKLLVNIRACAATAGAVLALSILDTMRRWHPGTTQTEVLYATSAFAVWSLLVAMLIVGLTSIPCITHRLSPAVVEAAMVILLVVAQWTNVFHVPWYAARLLGHDPEVVLDRMYLFADNQLLLEIDVIITCVHLCLPLRSCSLHLFQVSGVLCYGIPAFVLKSPEVESAPFYLTLLVGLILLAAMGRRSIEKQERIHFLTMLREKNLRVRSEFQLSQMIHDKDRSQEAPDDVTEKGTPLDSKVFSLDRNQEVDAVAIQRIADVGQKEQWLIDEKELRVIPEKILGRGAYGVVMLGLYHGTKVAVKAPKDNPQGAMTECKLPQLCNELRILRHLRHPNIVHLFGAWLSASETGSKVCVVLELMSGETLRTFVIEGPDHAAKDLSTLSRLLLEVGSALTYLHTRVPVVVHGDLKDTNIFVENGAGHARARLLDFGLARLAKPNSRPMGGSLRWMAPELLLGERTPKGCADVFSFGRVAFLVSTRRIPFAGKTEGKLSRLVRSGAQPAWPESGRSELAQSCESLVRQCTQFEPEQRPTMQQVTRSLADITRRHQDVWQRQFLEGANEHQSESRSSTVGTASFGAVVAPQPEETGVAVWLDMLAPGLRLISFTEGFFLCMGRCQEGEGLLDMVCHEQRQGFAQWARESREKLAASTAESFAFHEVVRFRPLRLRRCHLIVEAFVELACPRRLRAPASDAFRLVLRDLRWLQEGDTANLAPLAPQRGERQAPLQGRDPLPLLSL